MTTLEAQHEVITNLILENEKLKRERDEAREVASGLAEQAERLLKERDEARNKMADALQEVDLRTLDYERMKQERDEAREERDIARLEFEEISNDLKDARADRDIARLSAQDADKAHDRMVGELEKVYKERDEAREVLREIAEASSFDNIENWARNKARKEIDQYRKKNDLLPISWDV